MLTGSGNCVPGRDGARGGGFYRRFGDVFVLAAVGPEAEADPRGFKRAVMAAEERLEEVEDA